MSALAAAAVQPATLQGTTEKIMIASRGLSYAAGAASMVGPRGAGTGTAPRPRSITAAMASQPSPARMDRSPARVVMKRIRRFSSAARGQTRRAVRTRLYAESDSSFYMLRAPYTVAFRTTGDATGMVVRVDEQGRLPVRPPGGRGRSATLRRSRRW
jgi:hypothetical protein